MRLNSRYNQSYAGSSHFSTDMVYNTFKHIHPSPNL